MKTATREMISLALTNDDSVDPDLAETVADILDGRLDPTHVVADEPLLLTMTAAAKLLGVSRVTLWRMVKDGDIRPVQITPNVFRIRRQDLNRIASRYAKYRPTPRGIPSKNG